MSKPSPTQSQSTAPSSVVRPPFDPDFKAAEGHDDLADPAKINAVRELVSAFSADTVLEKFPHLTHTEYTIPAVKGLGDHSAVLSVFQSKSSTSTKKSVLYHIHGGGQVWGNRFFGLDFLIGLLPNNDDVIFASIEYRLAPESRAPAAAHDCYAGLVYLSDNATKLGIDPSKVILFGISGGGPLAAATSIIARNREYPSIRAQVLAIPQLDDPQNIGVSWKQFDADGAWSGKLNRMVWDMVLGPETAAVDELRCPAKATDLSGLPPAFIDVGECEVFRDGAVAFASKIWQSGGTAELHVWPGVYHGAYMLEDIPVTKAMLAAEKGFIVRTLGLSEE